MALLDLDTIIAEVDDLAIMPNILQEVIEVSNDPNSTPTDMEEVILKDQSLTSKVLRLANSAYYGYARSISTIGQATILLGFDTVKSMAIASSVSGFMNEEFKGYALDANELWMQSQTCAIVSRYIAQRTGKYNPEEAYIAGLLRDLGKTVLNQYLIEDYKRVLDLVEEKRYTFCQGEKEVFGFDHSEIGARVAENWNMPEILVDSIKNHHWPEESKMEDKSLVSIVHLADAMTMMMGVGIGLDGLLYRLSEEALTTLDIEVNTFGEIISDVADLLRDNSCYMLDTL